MRRHTGICFKYHCYIAVSKRGIDTVKNNLEVLQGGYKMIAKPEICIGIDNYGQRTQQEYQWLIEDWDSKADLEALHSLMMCVYKDGVTDGIELCRQLDTK